MRAHLTAVAGPWVGERWVLEGETSIGRDPANTLCLDDQGLSRRHCLIDESPAGFTLRDLGSRNGTFVNGCAVAMQVLAHGDQIRAGSSVFWFAADGRACLPLDPGSIEVGATRVLRTADDKPDWPELAGVVRFLASLADAQGLEELGRRLIDLVVASGAAGDAALLLRPAAVDAWEVLAASRGGLEVAASLVAQAAAGREVVASGGEAPGRPSLLAVPLRQADAVVAVLYCRTASLATGWPEDRVLFLTGLAAAVAQPLGDALRIRKLEVENRRLLAGLRDDHELVGAGARMREVSAFVAKVAPSAAPVLLRGESGTGKEMVARALHRQSQRAGGPFVAINCSALPEALIESELFGHEKGAFTGAAAQKRGRVEEAQGGTLFLDEIGDLAAPAQAKILRLLQEREFVRVGGNKALKADIRLVSATHRDLETMIREGQFRQDLYYRLNVVALKLPALRERREDIEALAAHFLRKHVRGLGRRVTGISEEALSCLRQYDWPGNVRELENAIQRALVLGSTEEILPEDLPELVIESGGPAVADFHEQVRQAKRRIIQQALEETRQDVTEAARRLGLHPSNLYRLLRSLNCQKREL